MPEFSELEILLKKYFPEKISNEQFKQFSQAFLACVKWNGIINVISRKDLENLAERHFLHSLAIAKFISFQPGTEVVDVGTGGGFPGIPLAIFFPEVKFTLVDSRQKKIKVVQEIVQESGLKNVQYTVQRIEEMPGKFDFVVSRAVASLDKFVPWVRPKISCSGKNEVPNGIIYLRGADIGDQERPFIRSSNRFEQYDLNSWFEEEFFETKSLFYLSYC